MDAATTPATRRQKSSPWLSQSDSGKRACDATRSGERASTFASIFLVKHRSAGTHSSLTAVRSSSIQAAKGFLRLATRANWFSEWHFMMLFNGVSELDSCPGLGPMHLRSRHVLRLHGRSADQMGWPVARWSVDREGRLTEANGTSTLRRPKSWSRTGYRKRIRSVSCFPGRVGAAGGGGLAH